eukprot:gene58248-biopygen37513
MSFAAYGQTAPKFRTPAAYPVDRWAKWTDAEEELLAEICASQHRNQLATAASDGDANATYAAACAALESYLSQRSADVANFRELRRCAGRATIRNPTPAFIAADQRRLPEGAQDARTRALERLKGRIQELLYQWPKVGAGAMPTMLIRTWRHVVDQVRSPALAHDELGPLRNVNDLPSRQQLQEVMPLVNLAICRHLTAMRELRATGFRSYMLRAEVSMPRRIFQFCKSTVMKSVHTVTRPDGSITANAAEIDALLRGAWMPIFQRYSTEKPEPAWAPFKERYRRYIPSHPLRLERLTADDLRRALNRMNACSAGGLDGWRPAELKRLPKPLLELLATMLNSFEETGEWPDALLEAFITLIPKDNANGGPLDLRPITVTSALYRLWAATRVRQILEWQELWLPRGARGFRIGCGTDDVYYTLALRIERALLRDEPLVGLGLDLAKAFDSLPQEIMLQLFAELGMSDRILRPLRTMYRRLHRRFRFAGNIAGGRFHSTVGILQGCPLSVTLLTAIMAVWAKTIENETRLCPAGHILRSSPAASRTACTQCKSSVADGQPIFQCPNASQCSSCKAKPLALCLKCALLHGAQVESYADDGDVTATGPSATAAETKIQKASMITAEFASLTGTTVAIKKSSAWTTCPRKGFCITYKPPHATEPVPLSAPAAGRHVGVQLLYLGKRVKTPSFIRKKFTNAESFCARATALPQRSDPVRIGAIIAAAPMSTVVYGCEVNTIPQKLINSLRSKIGEVLMPKFHCRRCIEILMTIFTKGHRIDPRQAFPYRAFTQLRRLMSRRPELRPLLQDVWEARRRQPTKQVEGPGRRLIEAAKAAGWEWSGPTTFTPSAKGAAAIDVLTVEANEWGHLARDALRLEQHRNAQHRRAEYHNDMGGIEQGINCVATRALWAHRSTSFFQKRLIVTIVTGATLPARRLCEMRLADSPHCPFCSTMDKPVIETPEHVHWECPTWEPIRNAHPFTPTTMQVIRRSLDAYHRGKPGDWPKCTPDMWPPCLLVCGIMPANFDATRHLNPAVPLDKAAPRRGRPKVTAPKPRVPLPDISDKLGPPMPADDSIRNDHPRREAWHDGRKIVFVDGGCDLNGDRDLARAGCGCYWGPGHPLNAGFPLEERTKTNNTAELRAAIHAVETDPDPLEIRQDNDGVVNGVNLRLAEWRRHDFRPSLRASAEIANHALWRRLDAALSAHQQPVRFVWVKGHTSAEQVAANEVSAFNHAGNNAADDLATAGIQVREGNTRQAANIANQTILAIQVQRMMLDIAVARDKAKEKAGMKNKTTDERPQIPRAPPAPAAAAAAAAVLAPGAAAAAAAPLLESKLDRYPFKWKPQPPYDQDRIAPTLRQNFKIVYHDATEYGPLHCGKPSKYADKHTPNEVFCSAGPTLLHACIWYIGQLRFPKASVPWADHGVAWEEVVVDFELATGLDLHTDVFYMSQPDAVRRWGLPPSVGAKPKHGKGGRYHNAMIHEAWVRAGIADEPRPNFARPIGIRAKVLRYLWYTVAGLATRRIAPGKDCNVATLLKQGLPENQVSRGMQALGCRRSGFCGWTRRPMWVAGEQTDSALRKMAFDISAGSLRTYQPDYTDFSDFRRDARARWREPPALCSTPAPKPTEVWTNLTAGSAAGKQQKRDREAEPAAAAAAAPAPPPSPLQAIAKRRRGPASSTAQPSAPAAPAAAAKAAAARPQKPSPKPPAKRQRVP